MTAPKYTLNRTKFRKFVLQADFMVAEMSVRADRILAAAEASAPHYTGAYARRFRKKTRKRGGIHHDRAEGRVINTDPAALSIEFGHLLRDRGLDPEIGTAVAVATGQARYIEGHYTLTRALDAAGG